MKRLFQRCAGAACAALVGLLLAGCNRPAEGPAGAPPPPEVVVDTVTRGELPLELAYSARAVGSREVEVRARVSGIVLERSYEEGRPVREGDVLFRIDPQPYRAAVDLAEAEVAVERARLAEASRLRDRVLSLVDRDLVSQQQYDEAVSAFEVAQASVAAAMARLRSARLDLGYTAVRAPISGLASREVRSEGSLVTAGDESSLLTRIVQVDPIYVEFGLPEAEAALVRARLAKGAAPAVRLTLQDGTTLPTPATLTFVDNAVEQGSGNVRARAVLPNAEGRLVPGQFVRASIGGVAIPDAVTVPRRAVMSSAQGIFVWTVGDGDKVELKPVRLGPAVGERTVIAEGLQGGERVVVEGVLKVQPGVQVRVVSSEAAPAQPPGPSPGPGDAP
ncbi:MAG: efflux RND transporter periplasmic adaptor subunit [Lysobacterales bacterium]|jgi:membrane fusion protein (multidrug efflux system)|nr:MAG: efflux RND transporter periplasmic adaptor subunit [Xanthomonadales bacterium]